MKYIDLKHKLKDFTIFALSDISIHDTSKNYLRRIYEWVKKGYIKKITRGYYIFSDLEINENVLFIIANKIYEPSYISFETALSFYNLIPERIHNIISASSKKTQALQTQVANFYYHKIKTNYMFGYKLIQYKGNSFKIADIEKCLLDFLYINKHLQSIEDFKELRLNINILQKQWNKSKFKQYLNKYNDSDLNKRCKVFLQYINNA